MIPGASPIGSVPVAGLPDYLQVASTQVLQLPVDYYMEDLPQYRATGRTYEPSWGRGGEKVRVSAGGRGRLSGPSPSVTRTTSKRGYD